MDSGLIGAYRLIWADIVLINDACKQCYAMNRLTVKDVTRALELIVQHESDLVYTLSLGQQEDTDSRHVLEGNELSTESPLYVAWEFFHGVFLNFTVEEMSQYPFWVAKTCSVVNPSPDHLAYALCGWILSIGDIYMTDGIAALFKGCAPYLISRSVESYSYLEKSLKHFLDSAGTKLERTANSIDVSKIKEPSQYASRRSSKKAAENSSAKAKSKNIKKNPDLPQKMGYFKKLAISAMCHPLLLQAVRMVTDTSSIHRNWVFTYWSMVSAGGITSLYKGLTTSILFGLLPIPMVMYYGISETVIYRRMAGQGSADRFGGGLSVLSKLLFDFSPSGDVVAVVDSSGALPTSLVSSVLGSVRSLSSSSALAMMFKPTHLVHILKYGLMTMSQIIPGFVSFAFSRIMMSALLGETPQRFREISIRKKILRDYLVDPSTKATKVITINNPRHAEVQNFHTQKRGEYGKKEYGRQQSGGAEFGQDTTRNSFSGRGLQ